MIADLERARAAIEADDLATALLALLEAWRASFWSDLADAIDVLTTRLDGDPIAGVNVKERHAEWLRRARTRSSIELGPLLAYARAQRPNREAARDRLQALVRHPLDPRIARFYLQHARERPPALEGRAMSGYWKDVAQLLAQHRESLTWNLFTVADPAPSPYRPRDEERRLLESIAALLAKPRVRKGDELEILRSIVANPDDDGARLVYADLLAARGDPRAELIVLQCGGRRDRGKEQTLLRERLSDLLGPLHAVVDHESVVFSRGFLDAASIVAPRTEVAPTLDDPRWWTLRTLTLGTLARVICHAIAASTSFRSLETLRVPHLQARAVMDLPMRRLEVLGHVEMHARRQLLRGEGFPSVRELVLTCEAFYEYESPLVRQLRRLHLHLPALTRIEDWIARVPRDLPLETLALESRAGRITLHRARGDVDTLEVVLNGGSYYPVAEMSRALESTPRFLPRIVLSGAPGVRVSPSVFGRVRALLAAASPRVLDA